MNNAWKSLALGMILTTLLPFEVIAKDDATRGIGIYPGRPAEHFGPQVVAGRSEYRNVALMRAASQSSAYDFNCTAQLVTDGLIATRSDVEGFVSYWKSATGKDEWITVDLGSKSTVDKVCFHWLNAPKAGMLQVSMDGAEWTDVAAFGDEGELNFPKVQGRYVRAMLESTADGNPFELSEWQIFGKGGTKTVPAKAAKREGNIQKLAGGNWKLCRATEVEASGEELSRPYDAEAWMDATVPGTVLASYVNVGAVHHPNYQENEFFISDSYFFEDFWYRNTFDAKVNTPRQFLHFSGINLKAAVYLNGQFVDSIVGAFREKDLDVTGILKNGRNDLAVKICRNNNYGRVKDYSGIEPRQNGGDIGADNPTMHATTGWDWIPAVRGRNIGIYDEVYVKYTGEVTVEDPFVRTTLALPDTTQATLLAEATLVNHSDKTVQGVLKGSFGEWTFEKEATLAPGETKIIKYAPMTLDNPKLWWPKGYGAPHLYDVNFTFEADKKVSDSRSFKSGVRQVEARQYDYKPVSRMYFGQGRNNNQRLDFYINGRRLNGFGGNWGFPEHLLNYREREYDIAVGYHAAQNFNLIRNWVGMTGSRYFYEACDRHGVMVWQDFWLANPYDGPNPADPDRFNQTAKEYVRLIRNHPSILFYVGRNEGYPPAEIDEYLAKMVPEEHPGHFYTPHSGADGVSGGGGYSLEPVRNYFRNMFGADKLHSERGIPSIMNYENLVRTMGEENVNPVNTHAHPNDMYGAHDYNLGGGKRWCAQTTQRFNNIYAKAFGEQPEEAKEFTELSRWLCYDGYRALFEARAEHRRGLQLWLSHPTWPSLIWQTYDYYFEPLAAYFACKKASEPIHIFFNPEHNKVEVVNYSAGNRTALKVVAQVLDIHGKEVWNHTTQLDITEDATRLCFAPEVPADITDVYFIRLFLYDAQGNVLSENLYWQGKEEGNFQAIRNVAQAKVAMQASGGKGQYTVVLTNESDVPAMMLRLKVVDDKTDDLVLPVWYSDNYFFLMPSESRTVTINVRAEDCKGKPLIKLEGFNCQ